VIIEIIAISGVYASLLISEGKAKRGYLILSIVQPILFVYMLIIKEYAVAIMQFFYTFTAIKGTFFWNKHEVK